MKSLVVFDATVTSASPDRQINTTVIISARFICASGNHPFLHPAQRPDTVRLVAALYRIAVIIGEIREDLQQPGGDKRRGLLPADRNDPATEASVVPTIMAAKARGSVLGRRLSSHACVRLISVIVI